MLLLGLLNTGKHSLNCFVDDVFPALLKGYGQAKEDGGHFLRVQSEQARVLPSAYLYVQSKQQAVTSVGKWIKVNSFRKGYEVVGEGIRAQRLEEVVLSEVNVEKDSVIRKMEERFQPLDGGCATFMSGVKNLKISVVNVGQGDLILIRFPSGEGMIVDAYYSTRNRHRVYEIIREFLGYGALRYVLITHKHLDHLVMLDDLCREFPKAECWWGVCDKHLHSSNAVSAVLSSLIRMGTAVKRIERTTSFREQDILMTLRYPLMSDPMHTSSDANDHSIVVDIKFGSQRVILGADLPGRLWPDFWNGEEQLAFLKVPHHGSSTGIALANVKKGIFKSSVTSCGKNVRYRHPHCPPLRGLVLNSGHHYVTRSSPRKEFFEFEIALDGTVQFSDGEMSPHLDCRHFECAVGCAGC